MSFHKSIHNFRCNRWNWIPSKTHLRYQRDISIHMTYLLYGGPESEKMFLESQETCVHCFTNIGCFNWWYLSNHKTKWNSVKHPFEMTKIYFKWDILNPLKLLVESAEFVQICCMRDRNMEKHVQLQMIIYDKPENETKFREIPIWDNKKNFQMRYGRASKTFCRVGSIYLNFVECRGPQMMQRVRRAARVVVQGVGLSWAPWTPWKFSKLLQTNRCSVSMYGRSKFMYGSPCNGKRKSKGREAL